MSLLKANAVQLGQSLTATNNFTWYQPATPDGTVRLGNGNSGSVTDLVTVNSTGSVGIGTSSLSTDTFTVYKASGGPSVRVQDTSGLLRFVTSGGVNYIQSGTAATSGSSAPLVFGNIYGANEQMRLDASGNLGLGVTPSAWSGAGAVFQTQKAFLRGDSNTCDIGNNAYFNGTNYIYSSNGYATHYTQVINAGYHAWYTAPSGTAGNAISFTQAMTLDASGNLLVGTTTASALLYSYQTANQVAIIGEAANASFTDNVIYARAARNTTNGTFKAFAYYNTGASAYKFYVIDGGNLYSTSATVNVISDQRLKENVRDLDTGLKEILALRPRRFDWKENQGDGSKDTPGFIAQEVEQVMPELVVPWNVTGTEADDHKGLATGNLIPTLVKAIQELSAQVSDLKTELNELKQKVNA